MAQKRCRMKKKRWIMQLKKETECVLNENQTLQVELSSLRAEIAHLKTLLLAHRNCSVTRAMFKGIVRFFPSILKYIFLNHVLRYFELLRIVET